MSEPKAPAASAGTSGPWKSSLSRPTRSVARPRARPERGWSRAIPPSSKARTVPTRPLQSLRGGHTRSRPRRRCGLYQRDRSSLCVAVTRDPALVEGADCTNTTAPVSAWRSRAIPPSSKARGGSHARSGARGATAPQDRAQRGRHDVPRSLERPSRCGPGASRRADIASPRRRPADSSARASGFGHSEAPRRRSTNKGASSPMSAASCIVSLRRPRRPRARRRCPRAAPPWSRVARPRRPLRSSPRPCHEERSRLRTTLTLQQA